MPVAEQRLAPRFPQAPYPYTNGTNPSKTTAPNTPEPTKTTKQNPGATKPGATSEAQTPSSIPSPSHAPVTVAPVGQVPATTTHSTIVPYIGSSVKILQGYCTEPNFTILDGPTALWLPVIGCVSSKAECCPTPMTEQAQPALPTSAQAQEDGGNRKRPNGGGIGGSAAFPMSAMPKQGELRGCPQDYHTVTKSDGTACCPSSYWLWSTELGGQIPCYSSLIKPLEPPPIPATLANGESGTATSSGGSITAAPSSRPGVQNNNAKPTSAIVNIAYAMQYNLAPEEEAPLLKKEAKIGIGVGAAAGGVLIVAIIVFLLRRYMVRKRSKVGGFEAPSASQRFGTEVDMSRVAHEQAGVARTHGGVKYVGVSASELGH